MNVGKRDADFSSAGYGSMNPFLSDEYPAQCTWYAWGRAYEVRGVKLDVSGHAYLWPVDSTAPHNNCIAVYKHKTKNTGHVLYVEKVFNDNTKFDDCTVWFSEANWPNANDKLDSDDGKIKSTTVRGLRERSDNYVLLGYLNAR